MREPAARALLLAAAVAAAVVLVELAGQVGLVDYPRLLAHAAPSVFLAEAPWRNPTMRLDARRLYRRRPGTHLSGATRGDIAVWLDVPAPEHPYDVRYDARGFRNADTLTRMRVAVIGDSFIETPLVPDTALLSSRLAARLGVQVGNFGQLGYGPQQELDVLTEEVIPRGPSIVVWAFYEGNDVGDVASFRERMRGWRRRVALYRSFAYNAVAAIRARTRHVEARREVRTRLLEAAVPAGGGRDTTMLFVSFTPPNTPTPPMPLEDAGALLTRARDLSERAGARFLLVLVPTKFRVHHGVARFADTSVAGRSLGDLPARLSAWSAARGIAFLDLTEPLRRAARDSLVFYLDDAHWNGAGAGVAAEAIAAAITKAGWRP